MGGADDALLRDLTTLLLFWGTTYLAAVASQKTRLSPLLFYLIFGSVYGNCKLVSHSTVINFIAELAITVVFFALGFEENVEHFLHGIKKAWGIASIGAFVPFGCGFSMSLLLWPEQDMMASLMVGLAVTATAVSLTMISLKSEGLAMSRAAIGIMTSAVLDDVGCLALVAIMVPIATGAAEPTVGGILWVLAKSVIFFTIIALLHTFVFPVMRYEKDSKLLLSKIPGLRSVGVHLFVRFNHGKQATLASLCVALAIGLLASSFSFHPAIGAYMAGLIMEERYFDIDPEEPAEDDEDDAPSHSQSTCSQGTEGSMHSPRPSKKKEEWTNVYHHVKDIIEDAAFQWLGPIFFLNLGSQILIKADLLGQCIGPAIAIYVVLGTGQILSAAIAAKYVPGGFTWAESWMIGFGMLGRAELFFRSTQYLLLAKRHLDRRGVFYIDCFRYVA